MSSPRANPRATQTHPPRARTYTPTHTLQPLGGPTAAGQPGGSPVPRSPVPANPRTNHQPHTDRDDARQPRPCRPRTGPGVRVPGTGAPGPQTCLSPSQHGDPAAPPTQRRSPQPPPPPWTAGRTLGPRGVQTDKPSRQPRPGAPKPRPGAAPQPQQQRPPSHAGPARPGVPSPLLANRSARDMVAAAVWLRITARASPARPLPALQFQHHSTSNRTEWRQGSHHGRHLHTAMSQTTNDLHRPRHPSARWSPRHSCPPVPGMQRTAAGQVTGVGVLAWD